MTADLAIDDAWPYSRHDPTPVILPVRPGHTPSPRPPVRIFLGTEEAQYRAERIFFFSIERHRDPSRVYEVHLMKNVRGFDRRRWRTGFTNYRYSIPAFAGGSGRAIYNDVDQIYLADPAKLFDLELGGHGYLAISAKDTSVMLIDCARMLPLWNREPASRLGKHQLINKPASTPGLWGRLDGHWNARDQEYVEGRTNCLHYTALHQQPWEPFPDDYSYHPNPLAYIWHDLEIDADRQGYRLFDADNPSPDFAAVTAGRGDPGGSGVPLTDAAVSLFADSGVETALLAHTAHGAAEVRLPGDPASSSLVVGARTEWPVRAADAVAADGLLEVLPPADLPWVLDRLFAAARRLVYLRVGSTATTGMGSAAWWQRRVREAARHHPEVAWQVDAWDAAAGLPGTVATLQIRRRHGANSAPIWAITTGQRDDDDRVVSLANAVGGEIVPKTADNGVLAEVGNDRPAVVIAAGRQGALLSGQFRQAAGGQPRVVQIGLPGRRLGGYDLVVSTPDERLPIRPNVVHLPVALAPAVDPPAKTGGTLVVAGPPRPGFRLDASAIDRIVQAAQRSRDRGEAPQRLWIEPRTDPALADRLRAALGAGLDDLSNDSEGLAKRVAAADRLIVYADRADLIALACRARTFVELVEATPWHDAIPGAKWLINAATILTGGGTSYRGTPHQQHFLARAIDELVVAGRLTLPRDLSRLHRAVIGRGWGRWSDQDEAMASRQPQSDIEQLAERIRQLAGESELSETSRPAA